jgi:hypothetical protein
MTLAQMQNLFDTLTNNNCLVRVYQDTTGNWIVEATRPSNPATAGQINTIAGNVLPSPVTALVDSARFQ